MTKQTNKANQLKSVKKQKKEKRTPPPAIPKSSTSKKSKTVATNQALDKVKLKEALDLKDIKAENLRLNQQLGQKNRELEIEAALERVRARTMVMQMSSELKEVAHELRIQLAALGTNELETCAINLYEEYDELVEAWAALRPPDSSKDIVEFHFTLPKKGIYIIEDMLSAYKSGVEEYTFELGGEKGVQWMKTMEVLVPDMFAEAAATPDFKNTGTVQAWFSCVFFSGGALIMITMTPPLEESQSLLKRCGKVFGLAYRRFADLKKAEALVREAQIELALERVRARTMAMQRSEELAAVATVLFQQVKAFGVQLLACGFNLWEIGDRDMTFYPGSPDGDILAPCKIPLWEHPVFIQFDESRKKGDALFILEKSGEIQADHYRYMHSLKGGAGDMLQAMLDAGLQFPGFQIDHLANFSHGQLIFITYEHFPEMHDVFKRFAKVFEQTYTRFLDLQKAEAQAREAQIEAALEKIRSRSLAMHNSQELRGIIAVFFERLNELEVLLGTVGIALFDHKTRHLFYWVGNSIQDPQLISAPYNEAMMWNENFVRDGWIAMVEKTELVNKVYTKAQKDSYFEYLFANNDLIQIPESAREILRKMDSHIVCFFPNSQSALFVDSWGGKQYAENSLNILRRAGKVFEQAYVRFLDLQKAEAQTRESQIQLALERVRARTMAMQHSDELADASFIIDSQVRALGIKTRGCAFNIYDENESTEWFSSEAGTMSTYKTPRENVFLRYYEEGKKGKQMYIESFEGDACAAHYDYLCTLPVTGEALKKFKESGGSFPTQQTDHVVYFKYGYLLFITLEPVPEAHDIFKRFAQVFEQTYTRFLDLQKAEAQAREAQIEAALEKVRSRSLAMHYSYELEQVVASIFDRLIELGLSFDGAFIFLFEKEKRNIQLWIATIHLSAPVKIELPYDKEIKNNAIVEDLWHAIENGEHILNRSYSGETKNDYFRYVWKYNEAKIPESIRQIHMERDWTACLVAEKNSIIGFDSWSGHFTSDEDFQILIRFARVFEQAYIRFLDLQKAEAQTRESQIETALERVRSRSMGMQKSEELKEVIQVVYDQFVHLNIYVEHTGFIMDYKTRDDMHIWLADKHEIPTEITIPYFDSPHWNSFIEAKEKGIDFFANHLTFEEKNKFYQDLFKLFPVPDEAKEYYFSCPGLAGSTVLFDNIGLYIENFSGIPYTDEENNTLKRFGKVFQQTYTRFLDLQKAEAQSREAQIELGLERVRARAMAMQNTEELNALIGTVFTELTRLDLTLTRCVIMINDPATHAARWWMANSEAPETPMNFLVKYHEHAPNLAYFKAWQERTLKLEYILEGKTKEEWDDFLFSETELSRLPDFVIAGMRAPDRVYLNASFNNFGNLTLASLEPLSNEHFEILLRFAKVFDLTYTRFNDLQKAEAQAKEARIEAALERVRSSSMAMHQSGDLHEVIKVVTEQLCGLHLKFDVANFAKVDQKGNWDLWLSTPAQAYPAQLFVPYFDHPIFNRLIEIQNKKIEFYSDVYGYEEKNRFFKHFFENTEAKNAPESRKQHVLNRKGFARTLFLLKNIWFAISNYDGIPFLESEIEIFRRFAHVFEQAYIRFLDLQKAEAQAKEAKIEASLERVRSKTMAMHNSQDVGNTVATMFEQLSQLGVTTNRCGIIIFTDTNDSEVWAAKSNPTGDAALIIGYLDVLIHPMLQAIRNSWKNKENFFSYELKGEDITNYYKAITNSPGYPARFNIDSLPSYEINSVFFFPEGAVFSFTSEAISVEASLIFKRFAGVFGQTYRRYLDLQKAEAQAREAQIEVSLERVRSKAMAMQKSEDLANAVAIVFEELDKLNLGMLRCGIGILNKEKRNAEVWTTTKSDNDTVVHVSGDEPMDIHPLLQGAFDSWLTLSDYSYVLEGEDLNNYYKALTGVNFRLPESQSLISGTEGIQQYYYSAVFSSGSLFAFRETEFPEEAKIVLKRFADVFNLTYTRFNDLKQAEAQAREAEIEVALERVRSSTMAMHQSTQILDVIQVLCDQIVHLGFPIHSVNIATQFMDGDYHMWVHAPGGPMYPNQIVIPSIYDYFPELKMALDQGIELVTAKLSTEARRRFWDHLFTNTIFKDASPPERKEFLYTTKGYAQTFILQKNTIMSMVNYDGNPFSPDHNQIFKRFSYSFEQSYVRFLDLVKAEAQAREARIEASLEQVRSKAMAMHSSRDLAETIKTFYQQIEILSTIPRRLGIGIINKEAHTVELITMNSTEKGDSVGIIGSLVLTGHPVLEGIYNNWLAQTEYRPILMGNELRDYYNIVRPQITYPDYPTTYAQYGYFFFFPEGGVYAWTEQEMTGDELQLYRRFSSVLSLTYKRYIDLKEAEAQARESNIQLALERVRARTMAMQSSEELVEASQLLFEEFKKLNLVSLGEYADRAFIGIPDKSHSKVDFWSTDLNGTGINYKFVGSIEEPYLFNRTIQAWKNEEKSIIIDLDGMELASYLDYLKSIGFPVSESHYQRRRIHYFSFFSKGLVGISTAHQLPPETLPLLERFAGVFDLTYTRFLDLQKAEAQVRESKIELALERVRARTMAMQRSDELAEAAEVLFKQFAELGNEPDRISIGIIDELGGFTDLWATDQQGRKLKILFKARNSEKTTFKKMVAAWKAGKKSTIIDLRDDDLKEWIRYIRNEMGLTIRDEHFNNRRIHQVSFFSQGWLNITTLEPLTDDVLSLLDRFAAVFNLTFTRFLDLKKAEAQTRQAQIETAMEKVRARSLAMQKPEELKEVAQVLRREMGALGIEELETCSIYILDENSGKTNCWYAIKDDKHTEQKLVTDYMTIDLNDTWVGRKMLEFYHADQPQTSILMKGEPRKEWIKYCINKSDLFDDTFYGENIPDRTYHLNKFSNGYLGAASPGEISAESWELLKRATAVFSLAYTRFSDLQRSEANTREAVKQASMDRVRAEIASMRAPADLEKIIPLLWSELTVLGVPFIRCGVFIMDNPIEQIHTYLSTPEGKALAAFDIPYSTPGNISQLLNHWRNKKAYLDHWDEEDFKEFAANLVRLGAMSSQEQYLATLPPGGFHLHFLPFLQGMLYVGNLTPLQADELNLIQSVADAFSTAYARYEDFNKLEAAKLQVDRALINLKQAQQQLVQSEKMASLGELTAGIAHEIQNPLNFVNNFSEVNAELIDEIKQAVQSGNNEEVLALAENVKQNLEKINFHGKRADGIVKSMLQHSRSSDQSGKNKKEPTDINVLADEYLRLAYHGLRAKDKTFNASLHTDFDESIGLIQVVSQDIARAILNLITNAFYAVHETDKKKKEKGESFAPTVSVSTKRLSKNIEIRVKDNGPGIPQHVLDKIFQPFFTTKPTGQGTGLGLSLAYDIVKANGGELKVLTEVGVGLPGVASAETGSEFIIELPI